ncbi:hypothetical protein [Oceanobacillus senegalensis]|uniref:hypothetical protein n=1 Tax=Oceanobacillus senegalensis TaxID=1936063 RepID=UPI000A313248|nr:hypothetical protein [Oceanobacillus senegalensis]
MKKYYVTANTAEGFINLLSSNVTNFNQIIILKHPSHTLKTALIKDIFETYYSTDDVEILLSALGKQYLDGIIIRNKALAIIDDRIATPDLNGTIEIDCQLFIKEKPYINKEYEDKFVYYTHSAYNHFKEGLTIHDDLEGIYIKEMDFEKADKLAEEFTAKLITSQQKQVRDATTVRRLFGTNTFDGVVNEVPHIIKNLSRVYHVKGRAGTGKSTFMKKIAEESMKYGYDVELYHCSFDPQSIDMVLVPELDFCLFDSTDPHEFFPQRDGEEIIDLYEEAVTPGTDEKYKDQIVKVNNRYKSYMKQGVKELAKAGGYLERVENSFVYTHKEKNNISGYIKNQIIK